LAEFIGGFALVFVFLNVGMKKGPQSNPFFGLAIAVTAVAGMYIFGHMARAVFNPAIAAGLCVSGVIGWNEVWIPIAATLVGGAVAAFVFNYVSGSD
jgi:glycerol uptake facilitator-like aquaporin